MSSAGGEAAVRVSVGVLCIQGAFIEHVKALERLAKDQEPELSLQVVCVKKPDHLTGLDGLIIPGGESTTLSVFLGKDGFESALKAWLFDATPPHVLWGTCAGLILIANTLMEQKRGGQITVRAGRKNHSCGSF